jgi:antitoxin component YwqK of YwqJK toxin-antitoxin module
MSYGHLILIITLFTINVTGQNKLDAKGRKEGPWTETYPNSKVVKYKGEFKAGEPIGKFVFYYDNGAPSMVSEYKPNKVVYTTAYHLNGVAMAQGKYLNQQKDSIWWYFNDVKEVVRREEYVNGKLHGTVTKYFTNMQGAKPQILEEVNYVNGLAQGTWKRYYRDGKVQVEGNYKDGKEQGKETWYYPSGKVEIIGFYKEGKKNGWWRIYETNGTTEREKKYFLNNVELEGEQLEKHLEFKSKNQKK